jgi:predicted ATPase
LKLYLAAAETAYLCGDFEQMQRLTQEVLQRAKTLLDKVKAYEVQIVAYISQNKLLTAKNFAIEVLKLLNITFPDPINESDMMQAIQRIELELAGKQIEELIDLPEMTEPDKLAAMGLLSSLFSITFKAVPELMPLSACKQVSLSIKTWEYG